MRDDQLPLLCFPYEDKLQTEVRLEQALFQTNRFDPKKNYISALYSKKFPKKSLRIRLAILKKVYHDEYHTDSFDFKRLIKRMENNDEFVWFWGSENEISNLLTYYESDDTDILPALQLGTVSIVNVSAEFGFGTGELCRSGSLDTAVGGKYPIIYRTLCYLRNQEHEIYNKFHTLCLVPRTRLSQQHLRGGEAVKTIHTKYLRSRFWGYAPWYVMQGNVLEVLEFREINRDVSDVINAIKTQDKWYFHNQHEADYAKALCQLNFNISPAMQVTTNANTTENIPSRLSSIANQTIAALNHETLICYSGGEHAKQQESAASFSTLLQKLLTNKSCCKVVRLNLNDSSHVTVQKLLNELGFRLTTISPPKNSWVIERNIKNHIQQEVFGFWSLPNTTFPIATPYYLATNTSHPLEQFILNYIQSLCKNWMHGPTV